MPTIDQLPASVQVTAADEVPLSQGGTTRNASIGAILAGTQPAISVASGSLLGRVSIGPGGPEGVTIGAGLGLTNGALAATGGDHAGFPQQPTLTPTDEMVLNSNGLPLQMPISQLRGLFKAGANVTIDSTGVITATVPTGPAGPTGPAWSPPKRVVTGVTDSPTLADDQGIIGYSSAVPIAVSVADLGSLRIYKCLQLGGGAITLQPASGVTLVALGKTAASVVSAFPGGALCVTCTGTDVVYVTGNTQ